MKLIRNLYPLLMFFIIIDIITVNAISRCETVARTLIQLENAPNNYYFGDCHFVEILFEEHQARQLRVSIVSRYETIESLDLHETEGLLADFSTPIYLSLVLSTEPTENTTKVNDYLFLPSTVNSYAPDFGFFTLYHDKTKFASMIYTIKGPMDISLEGNVGDYILRRLPLTSGKKYKYIYFKISDKLAPKSNKRRNNFNNPPQSFNLDAPFLETVNVKLLIVLDLKENFNKTQSESIKNVFMYCNYIDMLFGNFTAPKIRLTIKGIVIPEATRHNPCLNNLSPSSPTLSSSSLSGLEEQILNNKIFALNSHEIVIVMTPRSIDASTEEYNSLKTKTAVINNHNICKDDNNHNPIGIVSVIIDYQAGHGILLSQFVYMFTSESFRLNGRNVCPEFSGNIMPEYFELLHQWPPCFINAFSRFFRHNDCSYFKN